ncbi:putative mitochondrial protein [Nicotiana attenuata]|uniref:Mitochondrial protein n=1 Tax=Nicotiana attenuata TaxID=49451 RepID=A0A314LBY2_NICAT|nr:putative mitochondrial protein [Nicotiana attenuata]
MEETNSTHSSSPLSSVVPNSSTLSTPHSAISLPLTNPFSEIQASAASPPIQSSYTNLSPPATIMGPSSFSPNIFPTIPSYPSTGLSNAGATASSLATQSDSSTRASLPVASSDDISSPSDTLRITTSGFPSSAPTSIKTEPKRIDHALRDPVWKQAMVEQINALQRQVYVDDLIVTSNSDSVVSLFITKLGSRFSIKDLGTLTYFLGVQVIRTSRGLLLSQRKYIEDIVDRASMGGAKSTSTPLATTNSLMMDDSVHLRDPKEYQVLVGSLQYRSLTHPDIASAIHRLSQFSHRPTTKHWAALKRVIRYLIGTIDHGLFMHKNSSLDLHAFSDADWAGNKDDRTSTSAYVIFLGKNPISWSAKKQHSVARSSTEAEYRSVAATAAKLCWLRNLFKELSLSSLQPPVIYCDNLGSTYLAANPVFHSKMKHLEVDYHFVRSLVRQGFLHVVHVSTKDQLADALTKPLARPDFERLRSKIGVLAPSNDRNLEGAS